MSSNLPDTLKTKYDNAKKAADRLVRYRLYVKLISLGYKKLEEIKKTERAAEKAVARLSTDHDFFLRHQDKVNALFRAMRETYSNPTKTLRALDDLCRHYPAQYVFEVCQLGSYRLGSPMGWAVLGFRSISRNDADGNYVEAILPMLAQMLRDHRDYLDLRQSDIAARFEDTAADVAAIRREKAAIEGGLPTWTQEMTSCAADMSKDDVVQLSPEEAEVRRRLVESASSVVTPV
ncbi:MAG: hypothetical protein HQ481_03015 [Alphaproteobacteria bacterium]|nr:hypothetical protein [Alphaproteobacteria bacterium]